MCYFEGLFSFSLTVEQYVPLTASAIVSLLGLLIIVSSVHYFFEFKACWACIVFISQNMSVNFYVHRLLISQIS